MTDQPARSDAPLDLPYLEKLREVEVEPVFILGLHRSGTSILYRMLADTGVFNPLTAYHVICYDELLHNHFEGAEGDARRRLDERLAEGRGERAMDHLRPSADFAEEYGFVLGRRTRAMHLAPGNRELFDELTRKVQLLAGNGRPLLLKNPWDFPNFLTVQELVPRARFVFTHRHPLRTLSSAVRGSEALLARRDLYTWLLSPRYRRTYDSPLRLAAARHLWSVLPATVLMTLGARRATRYYRRHVERIPADRRVSVRYEDLCREPAATVAAILDGLGLPAGTPVAESAMAPRNPPLAPPVRRHRRFILRALATYCEEHGYGPEPDAAP